MAARFLEAVVQGTRVRRLLSDEHFSVDGTLIEAWASMKSFRPRDGGDDPPAGRNAERDFRGERRSNATHASATDADARLFRKGDGQSSRLCFMGHLLMENANALIIDAALTRASGTAEREAALAMLERRGTRRRVTLGADKAYDVAAFVDALRDRRVTPHIAVDGRVSKFGKRRSTRIDRRTTRHPDYAARQKLRKRIEEGFGWIKTTGGMAKTRHRGLDGVGWMFTLTAAAYNLVRLPKLLAEAAEDGLAKQSSQRMPTVLAGVRVNEIVAYHVGQPERVIEFTIGEQSGAGGDPGAMKLELQAAVEIKPQRLVLRLTRRVPHRSRLHVRSTH